MQHPTADLPCFMDWEASSLNLNSFPTEVAWSLESGHIESHLINPRTVPVWTDWCDKAEVLTGITRSMIVAEGRSPGWVCDQIVRELEIQGRAHRAAWDVKAMVQAYLKHCQSGRSGSVDGDQETQSEQ